MPPMRHVQSAAEFRRQTRTIGLSARSDIKVETTPPDILKKILESWDEIAAAEVVKNPFFKRVYDSQRAYAAQVVPTRRSVYPNYDFSADHYWPKK